MSGNAEEQIRNISFRQCCRVVARFKGILDDHKKQILMPYTMTNEPEELVEVFMSLVAYHGYERIK